MFTDPITTPRSEGEICSELRRHGATGLESVRLRANRSTIWSLTKAGRQLNLHRAFAAAPTSLLRRFVVIVNEGGLASAASRAASAELAAWAPLHRDLARVRSEAASASEAGGRRGVSCCGTPGQRRYLDKLYGYLNRTRFGGRLPQEVPIRLSNRMKSRLGQMVPGEIEGRRRVLEVALNIDLMLRGNGRARVDTLVHEMAHVADWLFDGEVGHGPTWKRWAREAGCEATACSTGRIRHRRRGERVTRIPPLPLGARIALPESGRRGARIEPDAA